MKSTVGEEVEDHGGGKDRAGSGWSYRGKLLA